MSKKLPAKIISTLDSVTIRFQSEIINRLKLFDFSKSAIQYFSESQKNSFSGYSFENLQGQFKLVEFKQDRKLKNIEYKDIVNVGNSFISGELSDSIFVLNMATFEHWLLGTLKTFFLSDPREHFPKSKKQIDVIYLKKFPDIDTLWDDLIDDYLSSAPYQGMKNLLKTFISDFNFIESNFTKNIIGKINENSLCRNVIMHNQKKINATYIQRAGKFKKFNEGEIIKITENLLFSQADNLLRFMQDFRKQF